jgi:predicted NBD/HSP70 family sugar kinase
MSSKSGRKKKFDLQSLAAWGGWVAAVAGFVTAWANCSNADTNQKNFLAQQKSRQDLERRVQTIESQRDSATAAATQAQAEAAKSADQLKRSLDHFVEVYRKAIDTANNALKALDAVEARKGTLNSSDYKPMHENAMLTWRGSLRALVKVVENGRQVLTPLNNLLDSDIDSIRGGVDDIDQKTLRELFIKIRESVDSKVETLNQALTTIAHMD